MKNRSTLAVITMLTLTLLTACADNDTEIPLSEIPADVIAMIQNILPGISLSEAEKEIEDGTIIYELAGKLIDGKEYEIEITESGEIIKIELDD